MIDRQERVREWLFLIFFGIFIILWAVIQPLNVSPDEPMRYRICQYLYENHALPPHGGDPSIRDAAWGYSYAFFPILPQMIGALFMTIASWFSENAFVLLMAARMVSVLSGVGTAWFALRIGEKLWGKTTMKWLFTVLVTMLPQFVFLCSYINSDSFAVFATSIIVYSWLLGLESDWSYGSCVTMAVGIILCALSYYDAYGVILASILLLGANILLWWKNRGKRRDLIKKSILIAGLVLLGISWWFIRNAVLYQGDLLGLNTSEAYSQRYAVDFLKPTNRQVPSRVGDSLWDMLTAWKWIEVTGISFIGCFGYMNIPLKTWMYFIYAAVVAAGIVAAVLLLVKQKKKRHNLCTTEEAGTEVWEGFTGSDWGNRMWIAALLLTAVVPNLLNLSHSYYVDFQPQGRYSMPMLLPLMYFVTLGWQYIAGKHRRFLLLGIGVLWPVMTVFIYLTIYYPATMVAISSR